MSSTIQWDSTLYHLHRGRCPPALHPRLLASCFPFFFFQEGWHVTLISSSSQATEEPDGLVTMLFGSSEDLPFHIPHRKEGSFLIFPQTQEEKQVEKRNLKKGSNPSSPLQLKLEVLYISLWLQLIYDIIQCLRIFFITATAQFHYLLVLRNL